MELRGVFAVVGIIAGGAFVLINAGGLLTPGAWVARVVGLALFALAFVSGVVKRRHGRSPNVSQRSTRTYWVSVIAEVVAIPVGATILVRVLHRPELTVLWVVLVVGAHFLPAQLFGVRRVAVLGLVLILIAVGGGMLATAGGISWAPSGAGVTAGMVLLLSVALPETQPRSNRGGPASDLAEFRCNV